MREWSLIGPYHDHRFFNKHIKNNIMAIAKNGILGGFSGSVGDVVGATWKGVTTIRSKSAIEKKPLTQKQKEALSISKLVLDVYPNVLKYIPSNLLYSKELGMTPMNVFQRERRSEVKNLVYAGTRMPILSFNPKNIISNTLYPLDTDGGIYQPYWEFTDEIQSLYPSKVVDFTALQFREKNGLYSLYKKFEELKVRVSDGAIEPTMKYDCIQNDRWFYFFVVHTLTLNIPLATQQWSAVSYD